MADEQPAEVDLWADDRAEALLDLVLSRGWREFAVPSLKARRAHIERQLALFINKPLEEIRKLQAQHQIIEDLIEDGRRFFSYLGG